MPDCKKAKTSMSSARLSHVCVFGHPIYPRRVSSRTSPGVTQEGGQLTGMFFIYGVYYLASTVPPVRRFGVLQMGFRNTNLPIYLEFF